MDDEPLIRIERLNVVFERWGQTVLALVDVSLTVAPGERVMIVGHNGSGKSTLLRVLAGRQDPGSGTVRLSAGSPTARRRFASPLFYVSQDPLMGTAEGLTLWENLVVADPSPASGFWSRAAKRRRAYMDLLDRFDLAGRAHQGLRFFSGGERQQIALLIANLRDPEILLLDEPFSALDPGRVPQCEAVIARMAEEGCTVLQVTHDRAALQAGTHRTIVMERGRIRYDRALGSVALNSQDHITAGW